jgi:hypothetical protein
MQQGHSSEFCRLIRIGGALVRKRQSAIRSELVGAPACPYLPGTQLLPKQALLPGSNGPQQQTAQPEADALRQPGRMTPEDCTDAAKAVIAMLPLYSNRWPSLAAIAVAAIVAGAPACPCLPGAQHLPQQALSPGSKCCL